MRGRGVRECEECEYIPPPQMYYSALSCHNMEFSCDHISTTSSPLCISECIASR